MNARPQSTLALLRYFVKSYPFESTMVVISLLLAALAETLGIGALLPLITIIIGGDAVPDNALATYAFQIYHYLGIPPTLANLLLTITITMSLKALIVFQAMRYVSYVAADVTRDFRIGLIKALMGAQWSYFTSLSIGKISNTISAEAMRAGHCYLLGGRTTAALIQSLIYVLVAFLVSWQVSLMAFIMGIVVAFLVKGFISMARRAGTDMTTFMNDMLSQLNDSLSGIKPLKAMGQEQRYIEKLDQQTAKVMQAQKKQSLSNLLLQIVYEPIAVILLSIGLYYVLTYTDTPVASVILLAFLFYRMMTHANLLQNFYQNLVINQPAVEGLINETQKAKDEQELLPAGKEPNFTKEIQLNNISICYDKNIPVLKDFSDTIPKAKITVIFGPSGVGKTSLIDTILGLVSIQSGTIKIDDHELSEIDIRKWRNKVGYVPQETFLFHDSIQQNITLGDDSYSKEDINLALEKADAMKFVKEIPNNIDHIVGERGSRLSGGQRQRVALARALIRKPELLILDEATSGLDKKSEEQILKTLQKLSSQLTIIIISHDPKTLDIADHVIKLG